MTTGRNAAAPDSALKAEVEAVMAALRAEAEEPYRHDMKARYGIEAPGAFGVRMNRVQAIAKPLRRRHDLALALWDTGQYDAQMVACHIDDPRQVTPEQMDAWRATFDNWATCDTACFKLFDQTPHAFAKVREWSALNDEFGKRAAFALLASLAGHIKGGPDEPFLEGLALIEAAATDDRNFVKKGVNWALRSIGQRRSPPLKAAAREVAARLAAQTDRTARWNGKDALRAFAKDDAKRAAKKA